MRMRATVMIATFAMLSLHVWAGDVMFSDGDFDAWTAEGFTFGDASADGAMPVGTGGNPDAWFSTAFTIGDKEPINAVSYRLISPFTHDPVVDGPIASISYSLDVAVFGPDVQVGVYVRQGSIDRTGMLIAATSSTWTQFGEMDLTPRTLQDPNFTGGELNFFDGEPVEFGIFVSQSDIFGEAGAYQTGIDNFSIHIELDRITLPGDLNGDNCVDQSDLGILLASFNVDAGGDLNNDMVTDQSDLGILLAEFGSGSGCR